MENTHKLAAASGWVFVDDTSEHTDAHYGVQAREDTVIDTWTAVGGSLDLVDLFGISGKTLTTDDPALLIPDGYIKEGAQSITLASGSINLLRT